MNTSVALNLNSAPLNGRNLIEASAGTGKTYTIVALYLRLILKTELDVNKILVMTFTNAATEELRARLRNGLVNALSVFSGDEITLDPFLQQLHNQFCTDQVATDAVVKKLRLAICSFDQASVYTIHGFCQRLLSDVALETNLSFENEVVKTDSELVQEIVDDYWRKCFYDATDQQIDLLNSVNFTPETLASSLLKWVSKPYLNVLPLKQDSVCEVIEVNMQSALDKARSIWLEQSEPVKTLLLEHEGLKRNSYKTATLPAKLDQLELMLNCPNVLSYNKDDLKFARLFTETELKAKTKKNYDSPHHPFFNAWETFVELIPQCQDCKQQAANQIRLQFLKQVQSRLKQIKDERSVLSYDDLLLRLHTALLAPNGTRLAQHILNRFPVALIDEFQDTDPIQYEIFDAIYARLKHSHQALFLVGDPKQAIYSFRGADIYTYLRARQSVQLPWWTLTENWRSSRRLVSAINHLFARKDRPFWLDTIHYHAVEAARGEQLDSHLSDQLPALRCWLVENQSVPDKLLAKGTAEPIIIDAVCDEIAGLLNQGVTGQLSIENVAVCGGDIAVLVRTNQQGGRVRQALTVRGIASVLLTHDSVFHSIEAQELACVLKAVLQPSNHGLIRAALVTGILGLNANQIAGFDSEDLEDQQAWDGWLERFRQWHQLWLEHGFMQMFRAIIASGDCYSRWLRLSDGERRITNLLHLGELINNQSRQNVLGLQGLINWFNRQCETQNEEAELRLESDENLVKIVTLHASKGLEYKLVFCPFLWDGKLSSSQSDGGEPFVYHDPDQDNIACLDMGSDKREYGKLHAASEALAEELRLLYVGLTRAKYHCTIVTGQINGIEQSALGWLLYGNDSLTGIEQVSEWIKSLSGERKRDIVNQIADDTNGAMQCSELPRQAAIVCFKPTPEQRMINRARQFLAAIPKPDQIVSFTQLTHGSEHQYADDESAFRDDIPRLENQFPTGVQAGICLHSLLEKLDFTVSLIEQQGIINDILATSYIAEQRDQLGQIVTAWLQNVLETPFSKEHQFSLQKLSKKNRVDELGFYFPVDSVNLHDIKNLVSKYYSNTVICSAVSRLHSRHIKGWMRGFIDLVYRENDCYYLADYKSNWLGHHDNAYQAENLLNTIADQHYYLQYLIYSVALHRFLERRVSDYDFQRHFGGVYYLFIRGMSPQSRPGTGIYFDKPEQQLIEELSFLFSNSTTT